MESSVSIYLMLFFWLSFRLVCRFDLIIFSLHHQIFLLHHQNVVHSGCANLRWYFKNLPAINLLRKTFPESLISKGLINYSNHRIFESLRVEFPAACGGVVYLPIKCQA